MLRKRYFCATCENSTESLEVEGSLFDVGIIIFSAKVFLGVHVL